MNRRKFLHSTTLSAGALSLTTLAGAKPSASILPNGYKYSLPGFKQDEHLLFIGDSITDMQRSRKPNGWDQNHLLGHSYVFLIAARLGVELGSSLPKISNRGISGHKIADLRRRWKADAIEPNPNLLSILIGTNDVGKDVKPVDFEGDYRFVLDASRKANPALKIILIDPFVLRSGKIGTDHAWAKRRSATDELRKVVVRLAKDYDALHLPMQDIFDQAAKTSSPNHWIWDGIHPLPAGHELIARSWLDAVSARWPA